MTSKGAVTRSQLQPKKTHGKKSDHTKVQKKYDHRNSNKILSKCVEKLVSKTEKKCLQAKITTPDRMKYKQKSLIDFAKIPECKTPPRSTTPERTVDNGRRISPRNKSPKSNISSTSPEEIINAAGPSPQHYSTHIKSKAPLKGTMSERIVNNEKRTSPRNKSRKGNISYKSPEEIDAAGPSFQRYVTRLKSTTCERTVNIEKRTSPRNISPECKIASTVSLSKTSIHDAGNALSKNSQSVLSENKKKINENKTKTSNINKRKIVKQTSNVRNKKKSDSICDNKSNTLNKWLSKTKNDSTKGSGSSVTNKNKSKNNRYLFRRQSSGTFEKYGMTIPSFQDIVSYQEKFENQKNILENLNLEDSQESLELNIEEPVPDNLLDCKNLSPREIQKAFTENIQYICDIADGKLYSERHAAFTKPKQAQGVTNLNYNTSMSVFTLEQKQLLLSELHKLFENNENYCSNNRYYFQVLLPELCLKMFMDTHNMDHDEAAAYLEDRPVDEAL